MIRLAIDRPKGIHPSSGIFMDIVAHCPLGTSSCSFHRHANVDTVQLTRNNHTNADPSSDCSRVQPSPIVFWRYNYIHRRTVYRLLDYLLILVFAVELHEATHSAESKRVNCI